MLYPQQTQVTPPTAVQVAFGKFIQNNAGIKGTLIPLSDESFDLIWHVGPDYMPQDIIDLVGTDALTLFKASAALDAFRTIVDPTFVPRSAPYPVTFNPDGSATVTVPPYVPEPEPVVTPPSFPNTP